jgi:hypothetical protein
MIWLLGWLSQNISASTTLSLVGSALTLQTSIGILLILVTIQLIPALLDAMGWRYVFMVLAIGSALGIVSMLRLRAMPEARAMASGNR